MLSVLFLQVRKKTGNVLQVNCKPGLPMLDSMLLVAQSFPLGGSAGSPLRGRPVNGAQMSLGRGVNKGRWERAKEVLHLATTISEILWLSVCLSDSNLQTPSRF